METDFRNFPVALDNDSDVAQQIGIILSLFALIERYPPTLMARITGMSEDDCRIVLGHINNISMRIDILSAVAETKEAANKNAEAVRYFVPRLRGANKIRNQYAHASWTQTRGGFTMNIWESSAQRNTLVREIRDIGEIKRDASELRETLGRIMAFAINDIFPPSAPSRK